MSYTHTGVFCASCKGAKYDCWCCRFCGHPYENCTCVADAAKDQAVLDAIALLTAHRIDGATYEKLLAAADAAEAVER